MSLARRDSLDSVLAVNMATSEPCLEKVGSQGQRVGNTLAHPVVQPHARALTSRDCQFVKVDTIMMYISQRQSFTIVTSRM